MIKLRKLYHSSWFVLFVLCLGSLLLYWSMPGRSFGSDDFLVMKRVGMDRIVWIKGFFRPLIDITLYCNYVLGGFSPRGYFLVNILIHGVNSFLLFRFCLLWKWTENADVRRLNAVVAALLFLCYPFHSESVDYLLGRASLVAGFFGMAALVVVVGGQGRNVRMGLSCLLYFIGMAGYESIVFLPLIVLVILYSRTTPLREYIHWAAALGITLAIHIAVRVAVSGTVAGAYGEQFLGNRLLNYGVNFFRLAGRFFLPPMESVKAMVLLTVVVMAALVVLCFWFVQRSGREVRIYFLKLMLILGIASVVPIVAGVSAHTSESERFIYFPSYFLCAGSAMLLTGLVKRKWLPAVVAVILFYECVFLERSNSNWVEASRITREVLAAVEGQGAGKKVFFVNLPDEKDGAFIFRLGLPDALLMDGRDTSRLVVVNHLTRDEERAGGEPLRMSEVSGGVGMGEVKGGMRMKEVKGGGRMSGVGGEVRMPPGVIIRREVPDSFLIAGEKGAVWRGGKDDVVLYWDGKRLLRWEPKY